MKKLILLLLISSLHSCTTFKKATEQKTETTTSDILRSSTKIDSTTLTEINRGIKDNFAVSLRTNNKSLDSLLELKFEGFNSVKTSGSNSFSTRFNKEDFTLGFEAIVGETKNIESKTEKDQNTEQTFTSEVDSYFSEKISKLPFWVYIVAVIFFAPRILAGVSSILNPAMGLINTITKNIK